MSAFCYQEFENDFDREMYCLEWQLDLDMDRLRRLNEISYYVESGSGDNIFKRMFDKIINFLNTVGEKIRSFIQGKKKPQDHNTKFEKHPKKVMDQVTKNIKFDKDLINKVMKGEVSMDDVKEALKSHTDKFGEILPYVGPVLAVGVGVTYEGLQIKEWKKDITMAMANCNDEVWEASRDMLRTKSSVDQKNLKKNMIDMIILDMQKNSTIGSNAATDFFKKLYVDHVVSSEIDKRSAGIKNENDSQKFVREVNKGMKTYLKKEEKENKKLSKKIANSEKEGFFGRTKKSGSDVKDEVEKVKKSREDLYKSDSNKQTVTHRLKSGLNFSRNK